MGSVRDVDLLPAPDRLACHQLKPLQPLAHVVGGVLLVVGHVNQRHHELDLVPAARAAQSQRAAAHQRRRVPKLTFFHLVAAEELTHARGELSVRRGGVAPSCPRRLHQLRTVQAVESLLRHRLPCHQLALPRKRRQVGGVSIAASAVLLPKQLNRVLSGGDVHSAEVDGQVRRNRHNHLARLQIASGNESTRGCGGITTNVHIVHMRIVVLKQIKKL
mmetsp:Transcript_26891/g.51210  ORF Transcript_26891/g.51210 Transcript_26891/m.51210 type:complete len:218 (+) Transcript_26891:430-1083(+)